TIDAVFNSMAAFAQVYRDPATFGLDAHLVARLLPDADLEALPRRAFVFPLLQGHYDGVDLSTLDPSQPQARRTLLAADHDDPHVAGRTRALEQGAGEPPVAQFVDALPVACLLEDLLQDGQGVRVERVSRLLGDHLGDLGKLVRGVAGEGDPDTETGGQSGV